MIYLTTFKTFTIDKGQSNVKSIVSCCFLTVL